MLVVDSCLDVAVWFFILGVSCQLRENASQCVHYCKVVHSVQQTFEFIVLVSIPLNLNR